MNRTQLVTAVGFVVVVVVYAGLSGLWTSAEPGWYATLERPSWQPPPWVFGVVWPLNFAALLVAGVSLAVRVEPRQAVVPLAVLTVSVGFALGWAYLFYVPHALGAAALSLAVSAVLTWALVVVFGRSAPWTGAILVPYAIWMSVATGLAVGYWRLAAMTTT